ncbi:hypothetical protein A2Y83_02970 [Candidatus Falkowbacteria bacterium RBG_13_39_14]|uniref:Lipoprotein signal peptidase n=1 Tax=Candidatus Falkowbacteria bacterium RBG_13_39_14 TaxID=1797985 RepID=A0A1F5S0T4_9BACT|nr:MAG: hypothetical protein A2Y83_02970 [Candidatus Falkowbacteria bacterium RBG_13_39_14]
MVRKLKFQGTLYGGILLLFAADRIFKNFFIKNPAIKRVFLFLSFSLTKNDGIAFGMPVDKFMLNILVVIFILGLMMLFLNIMNISRYVHIEKIGKEYLRIIIFLILIAAINNFVDRILYGAVIDYIELPHFVSLNIADIMITAGFLAISFIYLFEKVEKR